MKIQAILFMCNDFAGAKFTLENFNKWNPEIPIRVINSGGNCPKPYLSHIKNIEFINAPNLWHKKTLCGKGSFGPMFSQYFFDFGLNKDFSHTLLLETDILTNRSITMPPKYDISGITNFGGHEKVYNYLQLKGHRLHSGCGGTIFSHNYFNQIIKSNNYLLFNDLFNKFSEYYYMDFILTVIGRKANCTLGNWAEVSETKNYMAIQNDTIFIKSPDMNATLIHDYKI